MRFAKFVLLLLVLVSAVEQAESRGQKREELAKIKTDLARAYFTNGDVRSAIAAIDEAVRLDGNFAPAWLVRAQIYQYMKEPAQVEQSFQRAFSAREFAGETNNNYGWYLCQSNQVDKSLSYFDKAIADRTYPNPQIAMMNKGICLGKIGRTEEAGQVLLESARMSPPNYPFPYRELARLHAEAGNGTLAGLYFQQYINVVGGNLGPEDLFVGVKVGRLTNNQDMVNEYLETLKAKFPVSEELQQLLSGER